MGIFLVRGSYRVYCFCLGVYKIWQVCKAVLSGVKVFCKGLAELEIGLIGFQEDLVRTFSYSSCYTLSLKP